jgi:hypothetical protein
MQREFEQLHRCGARPLAMFCCEVMDAAGVDPAALDMLFGWRGGLSPSAIRAIGGAFPKPPLHRVPTPT